MDIDSSSSSYICFVNLEKDLLLILLRYSRGEEISDLGTSENYSLLFGDDDVLVASSGFEL